MAYSCFGILLSATVALAGIVFSFLGSSRPKRIAGLLVGVIGTAALLFAIWGAERGLQQVMTPPYRTDMDAIRQVPIADLQAWAVGLLNAQTTTAPVSCSVSGLQHRVPQYLRPTLDHFFEVDVEGNQGQEHVLMIAGGGLSEMHYGLLIGRPAYVPAPDEWPFTTKWGDGVFYVRDFPELQPPRFPFLLAMVAGIILIVALVAACRPTRPVLLAAKA